MSIKLLFGAVMLKIQNTHESYYCSWIPLSLYCTTQFIGLGPISLLFSLAKSILNQIFTTSYHLHLFECDPPSFVVLVSTLSAIYFMVNTSTVIMAKAGLWGPISLSWSFPSSKLGIYYYV